MSRLAPVVFSCTLFPVARFPVLGTRSIFSRVLVPAAFFPAFGANCRFLAHSFRLPVFSLVDTDWFNVLFASVSDGNL